MANLHRNLGFLDLPREIRDQIYDHCSAQPVDKWPPEHLLKPPKLGPMGLLRVCKQVHTEAAIVLYGNNLHVFHIGWRPKWDDSFFDFSLRTDTTMPVAPQYRRLIKSCVLFVNPTMYGCSSAIKTIFLKIKASVQAFVDGLSGGHSLKELQIVYSTHFHEAPVELFVPTPMPPSNPGFGPHSWVHGDTRIHVLDPLTDIYGVARVSVSGVIPEYAYRLERAISCSQKAVSPYEETYRTRMVKVKGQRGKKKPQAYRVGKYYESKVIWNQKLLAPLPPSPKLEAYK